MCCYCRAGGHSGGPAAADHPNRAGEPDAGRRVARHDAVPGHRRPAAGDNVAQRRRPDPDVRQGQDLVHRHAANWQWVMAWKIWI